MNTRTLELDTTDGPMPLYEARPDGDARGAVIVVQEAFGVNTYIEDVTRDPYDQGIVKAIATLAQTLGLRVIAEGIETEAQWEFVRSLRCDQAQGFLFHRPLAR